PSIIKSYAERSTFNGSRNEMELLPWGSRSRRSVFEPRLAKAAARLIAVVVLPTPPFWFAIAIITLGRYTSLAIPAYLTSEGRPRHQLLQAILLRQWRRFPRLPLQSRSNFAKPE